MNLISNFITAIEENNIIAAKSIFANNSGIDINYNNDLAFRIACALGYLNIAKWLYAIGVNIHALDNWAFVCAATNGHYEIVKWLLLLGDYKTSEKIDIYSNNCKGLRNACNNGHLETVKIILDNTVISGENIDNIKMAIYQAFVNKHIDIVKLMLDMHLILKFFSKDEIDNLYWDSHFHNTKLVDYFKKILQAYF